MFGEYQAWHGRSFYTNQAAVVRLMLISTISVTSYVPRIPGKPLNMQRHLAIVFPTLKELFRRMICT